MALHLNPGGEAPDPPAKFLAVNLPPPKASMMVSQNLGRYPKGPKESTKIIRNRAGSLSSAMQGFQKTGAPNFDTKMYHDPSYKVPRAEMTLESR